MKSYSLRVRKHAKTKVSLVMVFIDKLKKMKIDEVSIKDICKEVDISEGTFYNYFPKKTDLVSYYLELMGKKMLWEAYSAGGDKDPVLFIDKLFDVIADKMFRSSFAYELMGLVLISKDPAKKIPISALEIRYAFSGNRKMDMFLDNTVEEIIENKLKEIFEERSVPYKSFSRDITHTLISILIGTPLLCKKFRKNNLKQQLRKQLALVWKGLGIKK